MTAALTKVLLGGKLMFPSKYVAAVEFKGKDVSLTIASVRMETLKMRNGATDKKPVLSFRETKKALILNKTNAASIADMHGTAAEAWVGKKITLYPTRTQCGPETVDCIRVRSSKPARETSAPQFDEPEGHDEEMEDDAFSDGANGNPVASVDRAEPTASPSGVKPSGTASAELKMTESDGAFDDGQGNHIDDPNQTEPELLPIPADAEALTVRVADMTGMELADAEKKLKPQFGKGGYKAATALDWWTKFCTGQIAGLVPVSVTK